MADTSDNLVIAGNDFTDDASVLDILDHVLNAGVVIRGSLVISLAGVDLVYVGLDVILTSIETALKYLQIQRPLRPQLSLGSVEKRSE
jgi:gas vesicle structural protein